MAAMQERVEALIEEEEGAQNRKSHIREVSNIRKDASADSGDKDERIKKIIDEPATKSKKRINMVCIILLCWYNPVLF